MTTFLELLSNPEWVTNYRTEYLDVFFQVVSAFGAMYFYYTVIAIGYWLFISNRLFVSLAFLIPFSTMINCILKNSFRVPRPDISLHIDPVFDPFGFPSGHVMVATIFWGAIYLYRKTRVLRYVFLFAVALMAMSRVYLGVHSILDVSFGFLFGVVILYVWEYYLSDIILPKQGKVEVGKYWLTISALLFFFGVVSSDLIIPRYIPLAMGCLLAYGLILKNLHKNIDRIMEKPNLVEVIMFATMMPLLFFTMKYIPVIDTSYTMLLTSIFVKFSLIYLVTLYLIPKIRAKIN